MSNKKVPDSMDSTRRGSLISILEEGPIMSNKQTNKNRDGDKVRNYKVRTKWWQNLKLFLKFCQIHHNFAHCSFKFCSSKSYSFVISNFINCKDFHLCNFGLRTPPRPTKTYFRWVEIAVTLLTIFSFLLQKSYVKAFSFG